MSFSGGVYTLPGPALVTGDTVSATENNQFRNDVAGAFNLTFLRNGTSTATANLPMGGYKLTGLGAPSTNGDSLAYGAAAVVTTLTSTSLTATRVPYAGTGGLLQDASTFTFDGTTLTAGGFSTSGNISAATATVSGNITVSGGTANGVAYLNGSKVLTTGSALTFDGTNLRSGRLRVTDNTLSGYGGVEITSIANVGMGLASANYVFYNAAATTEYMRLDSSGNLGLGVTPSAWASAFKVVETSGGSFVGNTNGLANYITQNAIYTTDWKYKTNSQAAMYSQVLGQHQWNIAPSGTAGSAISFTQAMTLDASGNLGVGNTSPATRIHVSKANDSRIRVTETNGSTSLDMVALNGTTYFGTSTNHPLALMTNDTERMRIDSSGNVGIGTSSPQGNLALKAASGNTNFAIESAASSRYFISVNNTSNYLAIGGNGATAPSSGAINIDSSGNVGIGTSSPSCKLQILAADGANSILSQISGGSKNPYLTVSHSESGGFTKLNADGSLTTGCNMVIATAGSERMRIDSSGNLLVGTTGKTAGFDSSFIVGGKASPTVKLQSTTGPHAWDLYSASGGTFYFAYDSTDKASINTSTGAYTALSDANKKKDFEDSLVGLEAVLKLQPKLFRMLDDSEDAPKQLGFIAQEVHHIIPQAYVEQQSVDGVFIGLQDRPFIAVLVKAIQELKAELDATKAEVAALKGV